MKKKLLVLLSVLTLQLSMNVVPAKSIINDDIAEAIKLYKTGNYSECYDRLDKYIAKDSANALAYYYLGMTSAQLGREDEAIQCYDKAISLTATNNNLKRLAKKGKRCLETPEKCSESLYDSEMDEFIQSKLGPKKTEKVQSDYERLKIENLMREINRSDEISPQKFRDYKDFSSMNATPSNDEIVAALRTLQRAGFGNIIGGNNMDLSLLNNSNQQANMLNMMGGQMNPQLIQALLTNNMSQGF